MNRWRESFDSHPIHARINEVNDFLQHMDVPAEWTDWIAHLEYILRRLTTLLELSDVELITQGMLNDATNQLTTIRDQLASFPDSTDPAGVLGQVEASADALTHQLSAWPAQPGPAATAEKELAIVRQQLDLSRTSLADLNREAENAASDIRTTLAALTTSVEEAGNGFSARQDELLADLRTRSDELVATVDSQKGRLDQAISEFQSQFSSAQDARSIAADEARSSQQALFDEALRAANEKADAELAKRVQSAQATISRLDTLKADAERTTNAIGMAGMAGGYKNDADSQKRNADVLRLVALAMLTLTAVAAYLALVSSHSNGQLDYKAFFAKLIVSVTIGSIATYAIVQSAHHRERERQDRKLQIELSSIDSYLAQMPIEKRNEIKAQLAETWFGQPMQQLPAPDAEGIVPLPTSQLIKLIESLGK